MGSDVLYLGVEQLPYEVASKLSQSDWAKSGCLHTREVVKEVLILGRVHWMISGVSFCTESQVVQYLVDWKGSPEMISRGRKLVTGKRGKRKQIHFSTQNLVCRNCSTNFIYLPYYWNNVCILLTTSCMFYPVSSTIFVVVELPVQFSLVTQSCPTLCNPMDCSTPGFPILHHLLELTQTHVLWVGDGHLPSHPLLSLPLPAFSLTQDQNLFQWVSCSHQVARVLEPQPQPQSLQLIFRIYFL